MHLSFSLGILAFHLLTRSSDAASEGSDSFCPFFNNRSPAPLASGNCSRWYSDNACCNTNEMDVFLPTGSSPVSGYLCLLPCRSRAMRTFTLDGVTAPENVVCGCMLSPHYINMIRIVHVIACIDHDSLPGLLAIAVEDDK